MIETPLQRLARKASAEPAFLGWQLAAFARARAFDDAALAAFLGCAAETLASVRLCGAVRETHFRADVASVATEFGLDARHLAEAAKHGFVERAPAGETPGADRPAAVLAARDRSESP